MGVQQQGQPAQAAATFSINILGHGTHIQSPTGNNCSMGLLSGVLFSGIVYIFYMYIIFVTELHKNQFWKKLTYTTPSHSTTGSG